MFETSHVGAGSEPRHLRFGYRAAWTELASHMRITAFGFSSLCMPVEWLVYMSQSATEYFTRLNTTRTIWLSSDFWKKAATPHLDRYFRTPTPPPLLYAPSVTAMSKLLVVFGATGQQGGSIVDYVVNDPELPKEYTLRGVTRDPSTPAAQALRQKGVEVVKGDVDDKESLKQAMQGAHTVFAVTVTVYDHLTKQREISQGKEMADAAVAAGVHYLIFSSLSHAGKISGGKLQKVDHFDSKAEVEEYVRSLPIQSAFFAPGSFMQNFGAAMAPHPAGDGTYALSNFIKPETQFPLIDTAGDTGKYVGAILAEPEKYQGKVFSAATGLYSLNEIVQQMSKTTGKTVKYNQLPESVFRGLLPPASADHLVEMFLYIENYGYYGPQTKELVEWTAKQARGKLTTLEEYLTKCPVNLH
jgi:uncharacterized protein YbjT (DUF2867 family)